MRYRYKASIYNLPSLHYRRTDRTLLNRSSPTPSSDAALDQDTEGNFNALPGDCGSASSAAQTRALGDNSQAVLAGAGEETTIRIPGGGDSADESVNDKPTHLDILLQRESSEDSSCGDTDDGEDIKLNLGELKLVYNCLFV